MQLESRHKPIFYDPRRRRWLVSTLLASLLSIAVALLFGTFFYNLLHTTDLPPLNLQTIDDISHGRPPTKTEELDAKNKNKNKQATFEETRAQLMQFVRTISPVRRVPQASPGSQYKSEMIGFYVNWDDTSFTSLRANIDKLQTLMPEWLHLLDAQGNISVDNQTRQDRTMAFIQSRKPDLKVIPLINNYQSGQNVWDTTNLPRLLAKQDARTALSNNLLQYVQTNHFKGISIDFENIPAESQKDLVVFIEELSSLFHAHQLQVYQSLPADDNTVDYKKLGTAVDSVVLMMYDEHWSDGPAGPIASQNWYEHTLELRAKDIPANKITIAIGNYGYDWQEKQKNASEVTFQDALRTAQESEGQIQLDPLSLNMTYDYVDEKKDLHHVWFLDGVTAFNQFAAGATIQPHGWAVWRLGSEDPSLWAISEARDHLTQDAATQLKTLTYGYDIDYEGEGEVLKIENLPSTGQRDVQYDPTLSLITKSSLTTFPSPYVITRWGGNQPKKIALTFDDGPDPRYTEQILATLKKYQVPATFFVIGMNGDAHPEILKDIISSGNEIGIHTYTHPNISRITHEQLILELNASEQLLESQIGRRSLLFRPPYAEDIEPVTPDQVNPLVDVSKLGFYTIGMQIDPQDWRNPGVDVVVNAVVSQADTGKGNVVLLHDSGGDRTQTITALPRIIEALQTKGYQFVSISQLLGLKTSDVMPLAESGKAQVYVSTAAFSVIHWFNTTFALLFFLGIVLGTFRLTFIAALAMIESVVRHRKKTETTYAPRVSVLVPTYNEEKVIAHTIRSILNSHYQNFHVLVIDDGSTDKTREVLAAEFFSDERVTVYAKSNWGKADALNYGVKQADGEVIVALDADTALHPDAISMLVRHFSDPRVGAVAGNAKVGNRKSVLTKWQALEYITSQNLDRRAFSLLNCITVVPGAIGAWRRQVILDVGGFSTNTLAEDADLTLSLLEEGYQINYENKAIAFTEAPTTISGFLKQRFRWTFGTLQVVWKHRRTLISRENPLLALVALPNLLVFQLFFPLISPLMDVLMLSSILSYIWQRSQHPEGFVFSDLQRIFLFYLLFVFLDFMAAFVAFILERGEDWKLLLWLFWQRFLYRQLMYYVVVKSVLTAIKGTVVGWNKLERVGLEVKL